MYLFFCFFHERKKSIVPRFYTLRSLHVVGSDADFKTSFDKESNSEKLVVIDWFATWCGPCKVIAPTFETLSKEHEKSGKALFLKADVDMYFFCIFLRFLMCRCEESAQNHQVQAMPTFQFFRKGKKIFEFAGADRNKLTDAVNKFL